MKHQMIMKIEEFDKVPFNKIGGLCRAYELFSDKLPALAAELNGRPAA